MAKIRTNAAERVRKPVICTGLPPLNTTSTIRLDDPHWATNASNNAQCTGGIFIHREMHQKRQKKLPCFLVFLANSYIFSKLALVINNNNKKR